LSKDKGFLQLKNSIFTILLKNILVSLFRVLLSILFPPLAVLDKGCGSVLIVFILTICGWVPGVIAALVILNNTNRYYG
jgi:uncharacterized membrane protein YqaE (UPF0057 family)